MSDVRRFWWLVPPAIFAVLTILIVEIAGGPKDAPRAEDRAEQTFLTGPRPTVNLDSLGGDVNVTAHDRNEVIVRVRRQGLGKDDDEAFDNLGRLAVRMGMEGDMVSVRAFDDPVGATPGDLVATFDVTVPRGASLVLQTAGGRIDIRGVTGAISATTAQGVIDISLARDSSFRVESRSAEFTTDFPLQIEDSGNPEVTAGRVGSGDVRVEAVAPGGTVILRAQ